MSGFITAAIVCALSALLAIPAAAEPIEAHLVNVASSPWAGFGENFSTTWSGESSVYDPSVPGPSPFGPVFSLGPNIIFDPNPSYWGGFTISGYIIASLRDQDHYKPVPAIQPMTRSYNVDRYGSARIGQYAQNHVADSYPESETHPGSEPSGFFTHRGHFAELLAADLTPLANGSAIGTQDAGTIEEPGLVTVLASGRTSANTLLAPAITDGDAEASASSSMSAKYKLHKPAALDIDLWFAAAGEPDVWFRLIDDVTDDVLLSVTRPADLAIADATQWQFNITGAVPAGTYRIEVGISADSSVGPGEWLGPHNLAAFDLTLTLDTGLTGSDAYVSQGTYSINGYSESEPPVTVAPNEALHLIIPEPATPATLTLLALAGLIFQRGRR